MRIDISKLLSSDNYRHKNQLLNEMVQWCHNTVGEYLAYDADKEKRPYNYAIGKGWKIEIHEMQEQDPALWSNRLTWIIDIKDNAMAEIFILKFL